MGTLIKSNLPCPSCSSSDAYSIWTDNEYCFSCGFSKILKKRMIPTFQETSNKKVELPEDFTCEIPDEYLSWFRQVGINNIHLLGVLSIGYSECNKAICVPVFDQGKLMMYQLINPFTGDKKTVGKRTPMYIPNDNPEELPEVAIVEDIRSVLKVSQVVNAICLFGASVPKRDFKFYNMLRNYADYFYIWLDSDKAGVTNAQKLLNGLQIISRGAHIITTDKDPKYYSVDEIRELLCPF
jgi:Zn ribbon nucleic-acid-binding protein